MATVPEWMSLERGEEVVWTGKPRTRRILSTVAGAVFWSAVFVGIALALTVFSDSIPVPIDRVLGRYGVPDVAIFGVAGLVILVQAWQVIWAYLVVRNTDYVLTDRNVYRKDGVFSENVTRVGVDKIQNTQLKKDFFGNTFDYGTIYISTAGSAGTQLSVDDLDDPGEFRDRLRTRMNEQTGGRDREEHRAPAAGPDAETMQALVDEARRLRETAENVQQLVE